MSAARTLVRRGRPPRVIIDGLKFRVTVKSQHLEFEKAQEGLRRVDRNSGVDKAEVNYAKQVVERSFVTA